MIDQNVTRQARAALDRRRPGRPQPRLRRTTIPTWPPPSFAVATVPGKTDLAKVHAAFPDRTLYLYHVKAQTTRERSPEAAE